MSASSSTASPPEVEATLSRLSNHRGVLGVLILDNATGRVIRYNGSMFRDDSNAASSPARPPGTRERSSESTEESLLNDNNEVSVTQSVGKYARIARSLVESSSSAARLLDETVGCYVVDDAFGFLLTLIIRNIQDTVRFMRVRFQNHEIMITPGW